MSTKMEVVGRIFEVMDHFGIKNQSAMDKELGLKNSFGRYLKDDERPIRNVLDRISKRFDVSIEWLMNGNGPMMLQEIEGRDELALRYERLGRAYAWCAQEAEDLRRMFGGTWYPDPEKTPLHGAFPGGGRSIRGGS